MLEVITQERIGLGLKLGGKLVIMWPAMYDNTVQGQKVNGQGHKVT